MDGLYGRFDDTDRDMIGLLANQAAVALENARWSEGLERKVDERTEALAASNAALAQRAGELAIINEIQRGVAAALDSRQSSTSSATSCARCLAPVTSASAGATARAGLVALPLRVRARQAPRHRADALSPIGERMECDARAAVYRNVPKWKRTASIRPRVPTSAVGASSSRSWAASRCSAASSSRTTSGRTRTPSRTSACCRPSRPAWASRWRTPGCSTRHSACSRRPSSAPPSSRSSTASSRAWPRSSISRR